MQILSLCPLTTRAWWMRERVAFGVCVTQLCRWTWMRASRVVRCFRLVIFSLAPSHGVVAERRARRLLVKIVPRFPQGLKVV